MPFLRDLARPCRATRIGGSASRCFRLQSRRYSRTAPTCAPLTAEEVQGAHKYCVSLLSKYDRPSYTLSTFIPPHARSFYIALRALNVSLSMIPETTSSPTIGLMRLQFWRDGVTKILAGTPPKEPVAILLAAAISDLNERTGGRAKITKGWLTRLINAREQTLTNDPYPNLAALESYAENTYSTLMYLTLAALPMTSVTADHVASHIGKAVGIAAVLRGLPLVAFPQPKPQSPSGTPGIGGGTRQGAVMLPLDIMAQNGVKEEEVLRRGAEAEGLRDAVFAVATRASDHLITVDQMLGNLRAGKEVGHDFEHEGEEGHEYNNTSALGGPRDNESPLDEVNRAFGVFMPAVATRLWLERLQQYDFDVFRPELLSGDWRLPWKAYMAFRRKNFG